MINYLSLHNRYYQMRMRPSKEHGPRELAPDPTHPQPPIRSDTIAMPLQVDPHSPAEVHPITLTLSQHPITQAISLHLMSPHDLYFLYEVHLNQHSLADLISAQQLHLKNIQEALQFISEFMDGLSNESMKATLMVPLPEKAELVVSKLINGKPYPVISLQAGKVDDDLVQMHVACQYGALRDSLRQKEQKIANLREIVRVKNPYLLAHLHPH